VQAIPNFRRHSFAGAYTPNNANLTLATSITLLLAQLFNSDNGTFSIFAPGSVVTMASPLAINPTAAPVLALWSIGIYTFNALTLVQSDLTATTLTLRAPVLLRMGFLRMQSTANGSPHLTH